MPRFQYKAKSGPSETVEGEIYADSRRAAIARIDSMGYSPVVVEETDAITLEQSRVSGRGISQRDVNIFTRQLASLIRAGVSILRALTTIQQQTENRRMATVVAELEQTIRDGRMLSEALQQYPRLFPDLYLNLVRSGETGGVLDTMLERLADAREKEEEVRKKVQSALAYPCLMLAMGFLTVGVMVGYLLPRIETLFPASTDLPVPTRILVWISQVFSGYGLLFLLILACAALILRQAVATRVGRHALDAALLHVPLVGRFIREAGISRFARTLALLIDTGISIDRALALSAGTLSNQVLREEIEQVREQTISSGSSVAAAMKQATHFPVFVVNMIAVGEETGSLDNSLNEVAAYYEREVDMLTRLVTTLIEPVLILIIGAVVGFIVFAMMLPIFEIGEVLT